MSESNGLRMKNPAHPGRFVRTVVEVLADNLPHAPHRPKLDEAIAYHDACHLGRGLGQYEAPRALLAHTTRHTVEALTTHAHAGCSGGGGLVPRTAPEVSVDMARHQAMQFVEPFTGITTTCPTSKRMFERAGHRSEHLLTVLRRWLESR